MPRTTRREFIGTAALAAHPARAARRPNVILVLTDDQGYGDLACHGNKVIRTPNLDRLHGDSVRFTDWHSDPLCAPTRSALMTGRYSARAGVWATVMGRSLLRRDEVTMADVFAANGYHTAIRGKWHLGDNYPYRPQDRGFEDVLVHGGGGVTQTPDYWGNSYFNDTYYRNGRPEKFTGYCTDVWFNEALKFIEANRKDPFFLYLPTNAPHSPFNVEDRYKRPYVDAGLPPQLAAFYGMISNIDENMGRLMRRLGELGMEDDTILLFMTDNGTGVGGRVPFYNAGMRAAKATAYEGGHRVPLFLRWPGKGLKGGRDITGLASHFDLLPTLIELAGLKRPDGPAFDGKSLAPAIAGGAGTADRTLVVQTQQRDTPQQWTRSAVMTNRWRLVEGKELYDIKADPGQTTDVAARNPDTVKSLRGAYERWWGDVSKRFSEYNPIVIGSPRENPLRITCHDWHPEGSQEPAGVPWNQEMIKRAPEANGFWAVEVERDGRYEFRLRQQPVEANSAIEASSAKLAVGGVSETRAVPAGAPVVPFTVDLKAGKTRLETLFTGGGKSRGAFFVYARRV